MKILWKQEQVYSETVPQGKTVREIIAAIQDDVDLLDYVVKAEDGELDLVFNVSVVAQKQT